MRKSQGGMHYVILATCHFGIKPSVVGAASTMAYNAVMQVVSAASLTTDDANVASSARVRKGSAGFGGSIADTCCSSCTRAAYSFDAISSIYRFCAPG